MSEPIKIKFDNKTAWICKATPYLVEKNPTAWDVVYDGVRYLILFKNPN